VGLNALTEEEEKFHFKMWAINKSPLIIGAILDDNFPAWSLNTLSKKEIIDINQDPDGKAAQLVYRNTEEEWDVWLGDLSGGKKVFGIANWKNENRNIEFDLRKLAIRSANVRDPWTPRDLGRRGAANRIGLNAHELKLWILSDIEVTPSPKSTGYHDAANATITGSARLTPDLRNNGHRIGFIGKGSTATFHYVMATSPGKKMLVLNFVNFDVDYSRGNTRNVNIQVNSGKPQKLTVPLSGQSWQEAGRLTFEVNGFKTGDNDIVLSGFGDYWAPDVIGLEVVE
jgi:alpha-galactosidase